MNGMGKTLNILWLWPDILNQHGERGNAMALVRVCGLYGIETEVARVNRLEDELSVEAADIILIGAGELAVMPQIVGALSKHVKRLADWVEGGGILFATGTAGAALGVQTLRTDGSQISGLGLLDMECREREAVLGDDLIFSIGGGNGDVTDGCLVGGNGSDPGGGLGIYCIQIQMMDVSLAAGQQPLGRIIYGYGNNGSGFEGAQNGGVIFTNALGPVLVKNPWLTLSLIRNALKRKPCMESDELRFNPKLFELELASAKAIRAFNQSKEKPK